MLRADFTLKFVCGTAYAYYIFALRKNVPHTFTCIIFKKKIGNVFLDAEFYRIKSARKIIVV